MSNILITGVAGFIGSNLCRRLINNPQNQIFGIDNFVTGQKANLVDLESKPNFKLMVGDINKEIEFELPKIDIIYHLACPASPPKYQSDPIFTLKTSFIGTLNILNLAKKHNSKVLFSSTSEVYGDPLIPIQKEFYRGNVNTVGPRACYDEGKRVAETLCFEFRQKENLDVKIFRIFNTYGPLMDKNDGRVVSNFINQALTDQNITIYGDGSQTRSFQYIEDLVDGILALNQTRDFYGPVNLGSPFDFSMLELAEIILKLIPKSTSQIVYQDLPIDDPLQRKPDISLAKQKLNWEPKIQLEEGLLKTIDFFKKNLET
jgi:UDP-glucuronate decarboxylase